MKHYTFFKIPLFTILITVIAGFVSASAQEIQPVSLSLAEAIQIALEQNFDIRIAHYDPNIAAEDILQAEEAFDMEFSADSSYTFYESSNDSVADNTLTLETGIGQRFKTGGSYQLDIETESSDLEEDGNSSGLSLTFIQPLLKNRGAEVNTAGIVIAGKNQETSVSQLRATAIEVLTDVQNAYWDLILAQGVLEADRYSLQLANDLVASNEAQVRVGTLAPIEVLQAQATAASREVQIITDEYEVRNVEDELKRLLNVAEDDPIWQAAILPKTSLRADAPAISLDENIRLAQDNREEVRQLDTSLDIQELSLKVAENQLLPELNLQANFGPTGTDDEWGGSWGNLADFDTYSVGVGLNFQYPFRNKAAKSAYTQTKLELEQAKLSRQNLDQQIATQVRLAVRAVETSYRQIESTKIAEQLAQEQLEAEQKKFEEGLSTNFQVLDYQDQLATAKSNSTQALISYQKSLVALDQATGLTLQRHNIIINEG